MNRKTGIKGKSIIAFLLAVILLFQANGVVATAGTVSENELTEDDGLEDERGTVSEDTVSGQSLPDVQAGDAIPANPIHRCTWMDDGTDYTDFSYVYFGSYPRAK